MTQPAQNHFRSSAGQYMGMTRYFRASILWIDAIIPEPDRDSGSQRSYLLFKALVADGYGITFLPLEPVRNIKYPAILRSQGVAVLQAQNHAKWRLTANNRCMFDVVIISRLRVFSEAYDKVKSECPESPIIYDTVDLHFFRETREYLASTSTAWNFDVLSPTNITRWLDKERLQSSALDELQQHVQLKAVREKELDTIEKSNITLVTSPVEAALLQEMKTKSDIRLVSNVHNIEEKSPLAKQNSNVGCSAARQDLLFVGRFVRLTLHFLPHHSLQSSRRRKLESLSKPTSGGISHVSF